MGEQPIYLDHNATTAVRPEAAAAVAAALARLGNPSSVHRAGRAARASLEAARVQIGALIGLPRDGRIIFTSGGTEANQLAMQGTGRTILRSAIEHDSVRAAVPDARVIPATVSGVVGAASLAPFLDAADGPALVSVMAANNETGIVQPIAALAAAAHEAGALFHCDAVQAIGRLPMNMAASGIDLLSMSAHKFGGPPGVGILAIGSGILLHPTLAGGGQEDGIRAGTENLPGILGCAAALAGAVEEAPLWQRIDKLRQAFERHLLEIAPSAVLIGATERRLPNTVCIALPGVSAEAQVIAFDLAGICVGAGAACSSGKLQPSHVLAAMHLAPEIRRSALRISLGRDTTEAELDACLAVWRGLKDRVRVPRAAAA